METPTSDHEGTDRSSPVPAPVTPSTHVLNVPNAITLSRLVIAVILFLMIDTFHAWVASAVVFVFAASTDFLDGYFARRFGQVTVLGRIMDPFVDKIIVCGAFIFLLAIPDSGICGWTVFIIIAREMLVTSLRGFLERLNEDFSAVWSGKIKMMIQCVAVTVCLLSLSEAFLAQLTPAIAPSAFLQFRDLVVILTVLVTAYSGLEYVVRATRIIRRITKRGEPLA